MDGRQLILLYMIDKIAGERSIAGCYHILTGKKSAQSIQDAKLYGFSTWYGIFPNWSRHSFEEEVAQLVGKGKLAYGQPADKGELVYGQLVEKESLDQRLAAYDFERRAFLAGSSWWTGEETIAFSKQLILLSQVISHYLTKQPSYSPVIQDLEAQLSVKKLWQSIDNKGSYIEQFTSELYSFLEQLEDDLLASLVVQRLSGYQIHGRTFQQLSRRFQIPEAILALYYYQVLACLMGYSTSNNLSIQRLISQGKSESSSLTLSAQKTYDLLCQGYQLAEISNLRRLKQNTIEDHVIEIAIQIADYDFSTYISKPIMEQIMAVNKRLQTRKLSLLKEHLPAEISYFQIRLALVLSQRDEYTLRKV